jgi:hypothetical protein
MAQHRTTAPAAEAGRFSYCSLPQVAERELRPEVDPNRARLIRLNEKKWVNGTVLRYYFFDQESDGQRVFFSDGTRVALVDDERRRDAGSAAGLRDVEGCRHWPRVP